MKPVNCCDGLYNSLDVHFTSACDNKCKHCIDSKFQGFGLKEPNIRAIADTILRNKEGVDDVLFLGGEPCLYLSDLIKCIEIIKCWSNLKVYVTTAVPIVCRDRYDEFVKLLEICDGVNLSTQHHNEAVADKIRCTRSKFNRQEFYAALPYKDKIRINLNIVKPFLYTKEDITCAVRHYDDMGFSEVKLSEIQHGKDHFVSFEDTFNIDLGSPFTEGCQTYVDTIPNLNGKLLLKRSCFLCESTLSATLLDGLKVVRRLFTPQKNKYGVIYSDGKIYNGWR